MCVSSKYVQGFGDAQQYLSGLTLGGTVVGDPAKAGLVLIHHEIVFLLTV